jgi:hypothetical protein
VQALDFRFEPPNQAAEIAEVVLQLGDVGAQVRRLHAPSAGRLRPALP